MGWIDQRNAGTHLVDLVAPQHSNSQSYMARTHQWWPNMTTSSNFWPRWWVLKVGWEGHTCQAAKSSFCLSEDSRWASVVHSPAILCLSLRARASTESIINVETCIWNRSEAPNLVQSHVVIHFKECKPLVQWLDIHQKSPLGANHPKWSCLNMTPKLQRTTINRQIDFCHWAAPAYLFAAANPCEAFQPGSEMGGKRKSPWCPRCQKKIRNSSPAPSQWR